MIRCHRITRLAIIYVLTATVLELWWMQSSRSAAVLAASPSALVHNATSDRPAFASPLQAPPLGLAPEAVVMAPLPNLAPPSPPLAAEGKLVLSRAQLKARMDHIFKEFAEKTPNSAEGEAQPPGRDAPALDRLVSERGGSSASNRLTRTQAAASSARPQQLGHGSQQQAQANAEAEHSESCGWKLPRAFFEQPFNRSLASLVWTSPAEPRLGPLADVPSAELVRTLCCARAHLCAKRRAACAPLPSQFAHGALPGMAHSSEAA